MTTCERLEELRDYAMGELGVAEREAMERHVATCGDCAAELTSLQLTTATLRSGLPDREMPQRIAFVSDKVFAPGWFSQFWNSAARLGFASACVLAAAVVFSVVERPAAPVTTASVVQAGVSKADMDLAVNAAVTKAVAQVRAQDQKATAEILAAADEKHEREHRALMVAMDENMTVLQKRLSTYTMLASNDEARFGARP
jgi:anti-sigma factor RsiW